MHEDLKSYCEHEMKPAEHYQPWIILTLIESAGLADIGDLAIQYEQYEDDAHRPPKDLPARRRLRQAIEVLQKHGVVELTDKRVRLVSYPKSDEQSIKQACHEAIRSCGLPLPKFVSGGLPELGKR